MATNDAAVAAAGASAPQPAYADIWKAKTGEHRWWRYASRPFVLLLGYLILAFISAASILLIVRSQSDAQLVTQTLEVENKVAAVLLLVRTAESAERGYLLGEHNFFALFERDVELIAPSLAELKTVTAGRPAQQQALAELAPAIAERVDQFREAIRFADDADPAGAQQIVRGGRGRALMERIQTIGDRMIAEERSLLQSQTTKAARTNLLLLMVNLAGTAFMIALAALSIMTVRRQAEEALRDSERRADELQAALTELDAFSYSVSHDLRAPLRSIDAFSRILLKHHAAELGPEPREYLQSVCENAVRMGQLVDDLLAFARLSRKPLKKRQVATSDVLEQVLRELRAQPKSRSVDVTVGELPVVSGDAALLKQVFANLVGNAFKYTRKRPDARVEIGSRDIGGEKVMFVRDNGVGFDMKYADKLFGVFQRLHRAEDFEGTGVGLAIVQRIIHRHGGRVWAEAAVDQGATFYFTAETPAHA